MTMINTSDSDSVILGDAVYSILMSVYIKESALFLDECFNSIFSQSLPCDDVIVVHDGPLTIELYNVITRWSTKLPITEVKIKKNVGLGVALNIGLENCKHDLVARVDTDDINVKNRFKIQYEFMVNNPHIALCGGHISEFSDDASIEVSKRLVPLGDEIRRVIFRRNPFNHMTVMFRKNAVVSSGGYQHFKFMEDYFLWVRMFFHGYKMDNINEVLVKARVGNGMLGRRKGFKYYISEIKFMLYLLSQSIPNKPLVVLTFFIRSHLRLLPSFAIKYAYKIVRK